MSLAPQLLLIGAVVGVGVLHTVVPDHWLPITLIARQRGWSRRQTAAAALRAGTGHVLSTLVIAAVVWIAGVAFATRFGNAVSLASSLALVGFGGWIAVGSLLEMRQGHGHGHSHDHGHHGDDTVDGSQTRVIATPHGAIELSIVENGVPPRFRATGIASGTVVAETIRADGSRERFVLVDVGTHRESEQPIPEPHDFAVSLAVSRFDRTEVYETRFDEHDHDHAEAPGRETSSRTALLLILGSSPMVEGIPAFFAAAKYGPGLLALMAIAFGCSTIATYVAMCVSSAAGLQRVRLGAFERYGEVISGAFIAAVGLVFLIYPVL